MMVLCRLFGVSASSGGSSIYCDTLSVSQYDSKVRSNFQVSFEEKETFLKLLDNLFSQLKFFLLMMISTIMNLCVVYVYALK